MVEDDSRAPMRSKPTSTSQPTLTGGRFCRGSGSLALGQKVTNIRWLWFQADLCHWLSSQISLNIKKWSFTRWWLALYPKKTDVKSWIIQHAPTCFPPKQPIQTSPLCGLNHLTISICVTKHCEVKMPPFPIWNITIQGPPVSTRLCPNNVCWFLIPLKFIYSCRVSTGVTPWLIMPYL